MDFMEFIEMVLLLICFIYNVCITFSYARVYTRETLIWGISIFYEYHLEFLKIFLLSSRDFVDGLWGRV